MLKTILSKLPCFICLLLLPNNLCITVSTREQCQKDCQATGCPLTYTNATRLLGPTRPFHRYDNLGAPLSLTRPYPFAITAEEATIMTVHVSLTVTISDQYVGISDEIKLTDPEEACLTSTLSRSVVNFQCVHVKIRRDEFGGNSSSTVDPSRIPAVAELKLRYSGNEVRSHSKDVNRTEVNDWFHQNLVPTITSVLDQNDTTSQYLQRCLNENVKDDERNSSRIADVTLDESKGLIENAISLFNYSKTLATSLPNRYSPFCEVGCKLFYTNTTNAGRRMAQSTTDATISLASCNRLCDDLYYYNLSVGYSDLMEIARLECHDGCYIALKRCQPGYYCTQPTSSTDNTDEAGNADSTSPKRKVGGIMIPCPPGTYREASYLATDQCVRCPPGRYRSETMGTALSSCTKCPAGFYAPEFQSTSLLDCIRCPAGTFTKEEGSGSCSCITPSACAAVSEK